MYAGWGGDVEILRRRYACFRLLSLSFFLKTGRKSVKPSDVADFVFSTPEMFWLRDEFREERRWVSHPMVNRRIWDTVYSAHPIFCGFHVTWKGCFVAEA